MRSETIGYRAFLLRVWTRPEGGDARASIRDVETGESHAFDNLDKLRAWLGSEMHTTTTPGTRLGSSRAIGLLLSKDLNTHDDED